MDMFIFTLDKTGGLPLYEQLYNGIKEAIISQKIKENEKLPSKRKLADFLNISQTTIELAYAQLLAEGYISSKARVGYFVETLDELPYIEITTPQQDFNLAETPSYLYDFNPGVIDTASFPFSTWRKYARDVYDENNAHLLLAGEAQGEYALRTEIAKYLYQSRGVQCTPEQIVIGSGTEQLLPMLIRLFNHYTVFALENPGYPSVARILRQHNRIPLPITVDEEGINIQALESTNADVVYITPSHQFPTGAVLSATRRTQLLNWAAASPSRFIIEDDYDSEFRYTGKPIPALQALDANDKVIYMSTFTKSLMPSLRVAYFVLPLSLMTTYNKLFTYYSSTVPRFDQHIVANFMRDGHFAKHLNRIRKVYRKKHNELIEALQHYPDVSISGSQAGMHIVITIAHQSEQQLFEQAKKAGIAVYPMSRYAIRYEPTTAAQFLLGFGGLTSIAKAVDDLMHVWQIKKV